MKKCIACKIPMKPWMTCRSHSLIYCENCGLGALEKFPKKEEIVKYYRKFYDSLESERFNRVLEFFVYVFRLWRVRSVEKFSGGQGKLLDVGFSRAMDLEIYEKRGWTAHGTQVAPQVVEVAKQKKLKAFLGELTEAHLRKNTFDTVTLWHVLEHLRQPETYLREAGGLLKKRGKLIVEVPNFSSPIAKIFGCRWFELDVPHHLYQFTPESLTSILRRNGFEVEKISYFSLEQSTYSLIQSLLNFLTARHNLLFESLKKEGEPTPFFATLLQRVVALILLPLAATTAFFLGVLKKGDVMRLYCAKI